jgi:hypothetical protein
VAGAGVAAAMAAFFLFFWKTFSLGWYYQPRLKGCAHGLACPPFSPGW